MTDGHAGGASSELDAAHRALRELVVAATVRIHRTGVGYALDEPGSFLGSGFFIAPNLVLTCAHVAHGGEGGEIAVVYGTQPGRAMSAVPGEVVATLPDGPGGGPHAPSGNWPAPDLALVQLREPVDHDCVYVSERPAAYYGQGTVLYAGWTVMAGQLQILDGTLSVQGTIGGWSAGVQMRLGQNDLPYGVSGGPVIDPVRGEVIGVLKSRSDHGSGGTSTGIEQLRTLPVPQEGMRAEHDDLYQAVFHAHDRYHRDRQRPSASRRLTWVDVQSSLGARPGRTLTPAERIQLLGRLADLPPPVSTHSLLDILDSLPGFRAPAPLPAPRGWRDGLGALYESARQDGALELLLDYATRVLSAERPFLAPGTADAEQALWDWVLQAAEDLGTGYRNKLARELERLRQRQRERERAAGRLRRHPSDLLPRPSVLLEVVQRGWEPHHCDVRISVTRPDGDVVRLHEAERLPRDGLAADLAAPLAEAFRHCDEPGRPAILQVALPCTMLGEDVDTWRLRPDEPPLGAHRPVVVRCADRDQLPEEGEAEGFGDGRRDPEDERHERADRWRRLHTHGAKAEILDCDDGLRKPVPTVDQLRDLSHSSVPVLCRYGDRRFEDDPVALARIVQGGFGVALWRRWRGQPDAVCGEFHRRASDTVAGARSAAALPVLVHALRMGVRAGRAETYWADGIALFYDDPHQPLPGTGDLLEAP